MRVIIATMLFLLTAETAAADFSYDEIFVHYRITTIEDDPAPWFPDKEEGWATSFTHSLTDDWFLLGTLVGHDNSWHHEFSWEGTNHIMETIRYDYVLDGSEQSRYVDFGIGRRWSVARSTDISLAVLSTYTDTKGRLDWTETGYVVTHDPRNPVIPPIEQAYAYHLHDMGYRLELGVRHEMGKDLELLGQLAHANHFDSNGTAYHAGARYALIEPIDVTLRYVQTDDVHAWWAGVVFAY